MARFSAAHQRRGLRPWLTLFYLVWGLRRRDWQRVHSVLVGILLPDRYDPYDPAGRKYYLWVLGHLGVRYELLCSLLAVAKAREVVNFVPCKYPPRSQQNETFILRRDHELDVELPARLDCSKG